LLAAIRARPDDDSLRLAFADWLDGQGEMDFAHLIRLELERDKLPRKDPRRQWYKEQLSQPWNRVPADCHPPGIYTQTHRGLPWFVDTGVFALRDGIDKLGPYAPLPFVLLGGAQTKERQAEREFANGGPDLIGEALREIGRSRWLHQWHELQIQWLRLTEDRVRSLTGAGTLTRLETMVFRGGADDGAVRALAGSHLPRLLVFGLEEVRIRDNPLLTPDAVMPLLDAPWLTHVQGLILWGEWLEELALQALASCPRLAGLHWLDILPSLASQAGEGMRALLHSPHLAGLKLLNIAPVELDPEIAALLARPDILPGLQTLVVAFDDEKYRDLLRPRFGKGLYFGSMEDDEWVNPGMG
jgi:uncharacterized protein (TIGR02996 family)